MNLSVNQKDFVYLRVQRGDLDHLSSNFDEWLPAYRDRLQTVFDGIRPSLPTVCKRVLDVGSGLGGINALIYHHYSQDTGIGPNIHLLDGESDEPVVKRHDRTFNDMFTAITFLQTNGVRFVSYSTPWRLNNVGEFDLIISFAAWCFHIHPKTYMDYVLKHCHDKTVLILDVRRNEWREIVERNFNVESTVGMGGKYDRLILKPKETRK